MSWKPDHPPIYLLALETEPPIRDPGGEPCRSLPIWRRLKAKNLAQADQRGLTDRAETLFFLQCVTGFASDELAELDAFDLGRAATAMNAFLMRGPKASLEKFVSGLSLPSSQGSTPKS